MQGKSFEEVLERMQQLPITEPFDLIVAIANGGIIPAALLNQTLGLDLHLLKLHLRDAHQKQLYDAPQLLEPLRVDVRGKRILLVEDRIKTGTTVLFAVDLLKKAGAQCVKTFAVNGPADYSLYNETCFRFPWIRTQTKT